jgi:uncharacterized DUF497 family protein
MAVVWDPVKARTNRDKHGVEFRDAAEIFGGPTIQFPDRRREYREDRILAFGRANGVVLLVVFVRRGVEVRLISARRASKKESVRYEAATSDFDES